MASAGPPVEDTVPVVATGQSRRRVARRYLPAESTTTAPMVTGGAGAGIRFRRRGDDRFAGVPAGPGESYRGRLVTLPKRAQRKRSTWLGPTPRVRRPAGDLVQPDADNAVGRAAG